MTCGPPLPSFHTFSWAPSLQCLCAISLSFLLPPCVFQLQSPQRNPANTFHTSPQARERETRFALTSGLNMMRGINEIDGCLFGERWWGKDLAQWLGLTLWVELRNVSPPTLKFCHWLCFITKTCVPIHHETICLAPEFNICIFM